MPNRWSLGMGVGRFSKEWAGAVMFRNEYSGQYLVIQKLEKRFQSVMAGPVRDSPGPRDRW